MVVINNKIKSFYDELCLNGKPGRLGKVFKTERNYYFLDMGTGKVACLKENVYKVLKCITESNSYEDLAALDLEDKELEGAITEIKEAVKLEHILSASTLKTLTGSAVTHLKETLDNGVENVTLEVTEKCNLRCKYCIYNPSHKEYREFGHRDMSWETAKKAIDFLRDHSKDAEHVHIGFYGGEPLLNFKLVEQAVEYAKNNFKEITFAMTTNAAMINDEIAQYLLQNDFDIIVSIDGPREIHDANRITVDGEGSFEKTVRGTKILLNTQKVLGKKSKVSFNMVISGPNYEKSYNQVQQFLDSEDWIPKDIMILTASVDHGPKDSAYFIPQSKQEREFFEGSYDPLNEWDWDNRKNSKKHDMKKALFSDGVIDKGMLIIHKRLLSEYPVQAYGMNGCCVPGQRRIYVTVDGKFLLCEKVGNIPDIGDVDNGFNMDRIQKLYVDEFIDNAKKFCKDCWAVNLCTMCYVNCYDQYGPHFSYRHNSCRNERLYLENNLIRYHTELEENPESLVEYNEKDFR